MSELFSFTVETGPSPPVAARAGRLFLPHGPVATPIFMPVATQAALKGLTVAQLEALEVEIILGDTYHLGLRPGEQVFREITRRKNAARANPEQGRDPEQDPVRDNMDGVHFFEGWRRNVLTDSGGFQMVSLLKLAEITEEGVRFQSTHGGGGRAAVGPQKEDIDEAGAKNPYSLLLRPEDSIGIQNAIGADIMMQLDDVVHVLTTGPRVEEAAKRSLRWLDRSLAANANPEKQCIFGIVQGALDPELRRECLREITKRTACKGFAIGGLSGGEAKDDFWRIVRLCTSEGGLPEDKPRYCMGVGYPEDILVCIALGVDMFDCVFACRTARFGSALTSTGKIHLGKRQYANDPAPLDAACNCMTCKTYTRAYLHTISASKHSISATLLTYHNIAYLLNLTRGARTAILEGRFTEYVQDFFSSYYPEKNYPQWVVGALRAVNIELK